MGKYSIEEYKEEGRLDELFALLRRLVFHVFNCYPNFNLDEDDMLGMGHMAFMKAVKNFKTNDSTKFSTYFTCILINDIKMEMRYSRNRDKYYTTIHLNDVISTSDDGQELIVADTLGEGVFDESVCDRETLYHIIEKVKLTDKPRKVFVLRFVHGLTFAEVAKTLDMGLTNATKMYYVVIGKLKKLAKEEGLI